MKFKNFDASEPTSWRKFRGDLKNSSFVPQKTSLPQNLIWREKPRGALASSPLATNGFLILGGLDNKLYFLDAKTGEKKKNLKTKSHISSSPFLEDSILYFSSEQDDGNLYALNLLDGEILWQKDFKDPSNSPLVIDEKIYLGTYDGRFFCLDGTSGKVLWFFKAGDIIKSIPACDNGFLYFGSGDRNFYSLDKESGKEIWRYKAGSAIYSSPAIKKGMVFFGCLDGTFYALDKTKGDSVWKFDTQGKIFSSPAVDDLKVYFGSNDGYLYAVNSTSGKLEWRFDAESAINSSPIVVGDKLFFGSLDGSFFVLNKANGELLWSYRTEGMILSEPVFYDGRIYITTFNGWVYCFGE